MTDSEPRAMEQCPQCQGSLTTSQDRWKICHACGYSSPGGSLPHTVRTLSCLTPLAELEDDPLVADSHGQQVMCRMWADRHGVQLADHVTMAHRSADDRVLWQGDPDGFVVPSWRILARVVTDASEFCALAEQRNTPVFFADTDVPEPTYGTALKGRIHRLRSMPTLGATAAPSAADYGYTAA